MCNSSNLNGNYLIISPNILRYREPKIIGPKVSDKITIGNKIFNRIGYVIHIGATIEEGHYISIIKKNNEWYEVSDSTVKIITEDQLKFDKII